MTSRKFAFFRFSPYIFFFSLFCVSSASLQIHYIEDYCNGWLDSTLLLRQYVSGILNSFPHKMDSGECTLRLKPDIGYSVVLSVSKINLSPTDQLVITDSDNFKVALLGEKQSFSDERKSFLSDGTMSIHYVWNNTQTWKSQLRFQFIFTQVHREPCRDDEFKCRNKMCVAKKFTCDGHNHCGDRSDQEDCGGGLKTVYPEKITVKSRTNVWIITIIVCGVILAITIIVFIILVVRTNIQRKKNLKNKNSSPTVPAAAAPTVPAAIPQSPTAPPEVLVQPSVFSRLRQSLRRTKPSTTPNPEEPKTESYEVPSMYPQLPSVQHSGGVDNPEFKSDEN